MRRLSTKWSPSMIVALLALVLSVTGNAAAAVLITSNSQVAQNTIAGHQVPSGKHSNIIAGTISKTDLAPSALVHCPAQMAQVGGICFDRVTAGGGGVSWPTAIANCGGRHLRIPTISEFLFVLQNLTPVTQKPAWTDGYDGNGFVFVVGRDQYGDTSFEARPYTEDHPVHCIVDASA